MAITRVPSRSGPLLTNSRNSRGHRCDFGLPGSVASSPRRGPGAYSASPIEPDVYPS